MAHHMQVEHPLLRDLLAHIELMIRPQGGGVATFGSLAMSAFDETTTDSEIERMQAADGSLISTFGDAYK